MGTRHLYWIFTGPSFAVSRTEDHFPFIYLSMVFPVFYIKIYPSISASCLECRVQSTKTSSSTLAFSSRKYYTVCRLRCSPSLLFGVILLLLILPRNMLVDCVHYTVCCFYSFSCTVKCLNLSWVSCIWNYSRMPSSCNELYNNFILKR